MTIFENNMKIISKRFPEVFSSLNGIEVEKINIYTSKSRVDTFEAFGIRIHSAYDPIAEANLQMEPLKGDKKVSVFGIGFGYLITVLLESGFCDEVTGIIMNRSVFLSCLKNKELPFLKDDRFQLKYKADSELNSPFAVIPPLLLNAEKSLYSTRDKLRLKLREGWANNKWQQKNIELKNNISGNKKFIDKDPPISELIKKYENQPKPVMIVGAGPSLDIYIDQIDTFKENFFIIALDAIYPQLVQKGICPDIVVVLDPSDVNLEFFCDKTIEESAKKTNLVYFPTISPKIPPVWKNKRFVAYNKLSAVLLNPPEDDQLETQGSVIHPALDICRRINAVNIVLAGIDFSFPERKKYANGSKVNPIINEIGLVKIKSWSNGEVESQQNYIEYLRDTEDFFSENQNIQVFNISEIGAYIKGTRHLSITNTVMELGLG